MPQPEPAFAFAGRAEDGADPEMQSGAKPSQLAAYILYKSGACRRTDPDECLDPVAVGAALPNEEGDNLLVPLEGNAFPSEQFIKQSEPAWENVRFSNDAHRNANWAYGLLILAPFDADDNDISTAKIAAMPDDTPFAVGPLVVETSSVEPLELQRLGLNPADETTLTSVTVVKRPRPATACDASQEESCAVLTALDIETRDVSFTVKSLGSLREELTFPSLFGEEELIRNP